MAQYTRAINKGRPQREFKRKLKEIVQSGYFIKKPEEKIENGFGDYNQNKTTTLIVKYEDSEPTDAYLFTILDRKSEGLVKLLNLMGMNY